MRRGERIGKQKGNGLHEWRTVVLRPLCTSQELDEHRNTLRCIWRARKRVEDTEIVKATLFLVTYRKGEIALAMLNRLAVCSAVRLAHHHQTVMVMQPKLDSMFFPVLKY